MTANKILESCDRYLAKISILYKGEVSRSTSHVGKGEKKMKFKRPAKLKLAKNKS